MNARKLRIEFGAMADPIQKQLTAQGHYRIAVHAFQQVADSITLLKIHGYMSVASTERARKKLLREIIAAVQQR